MAMIFMVEAVFYAGGSLGTFYLKVFFCQLFRERLFSFQVVRVADLSASLVDKAAHRAAAFMGLLSRLLFVFLYLDDKQKFCACIVARLAEVPRQKRQSGLCACVLVLP